MSKVVVIGGGAAGMFASIAAAGCGHQVVVYEKNEKLGKKLYITGNIPPGEYVRKNETQRN